MAELGLVHTKPCPSREGVCSPRKQAEGSVINPNQPADLSTASILQRPEHPGRLTGSTYLLRREIREVSMKIKRKYSNRILHKQQETIWTLLLQLRKKTLNDYQNVGDRYFDTANVIQLLMDLWHIPWFWSASPNPLLEKHCYCRGSSVQPRGGKCTDRF